jgi:outer membrane protein assembly factor BamB
MHCLVSHDVEGTNLSSAFRFTRDFCFARRVFPTLVLLGVALLSSSFAQLPVPTSRGDNARTGANTNETLLTPANVNQNSFGHLFSVPVDYIVMAQPLFVPNVNIPGQGIHNVIYVVTQADSVYAIDAGNGTQLWHASMLNGGTTASGTFLPCGTAAGFSQEGIVGTPAIDTATNTMYLVAKTLLNTTVRHHIHALDITTGNERQSPVLITAKSTSKKGHVTVFNSLHQKNRPGLLLLNGVLYMGFGSNACNDANTGWVLAYDAASLSQLAAFNTSPDHGLTSIWQTGNGLAGDEAGNIFVETGEAGTNQYDVPTGGETYCNSVVKLFPDLSVADFFTPWSVAFLNANDLDLSSSGALILPDQDGPYPHELIASGKQGIVYVLNRDNLGMFSTNDSQVLQEFALVPNPNNIDVLMSSAAYWNKTVYFAPNGSPLLAFPLSGGLLGTPLTTARSYNGGHSPSISANGNTNGIVWDITGQLLAFDAVSLQLLYGTNQAPNGRDKLPPLGHFATQTVANGRVYIGTQNSLEAYGLLHALNISATPVNIAAPGATTGNTSTVTVTPKNGFVGGVQLSCALSAIPAGAQSPPTCSIPSSVNIAGASAATATMTITSTAATSGALVFPWPNRTRWLAANDGGAFLVGIFLLGIPARGRRRRFLLSFVLAMLGSFVGCGSGGSNGTGGIPGTTPGTYTFRVTATSQDVSANTAVVVTIK